MEHLSFVLWVLLYPLCHSIDGLISAKRREITGEPEPSDNTKLLSSVIGLTIWVMVAKSIY